MAATDPDLCAACGEQFRPAQVCDGCRKTRMRDRLLWAPRGCWRAWLMVFGDARHGHLSLEGAAGRASQPPGSGLAGGIVDPDDPDTAAEQILRQAEAGAIQSEAKDESRRHAAHREQDARDDVILAEIRRLEAELRALKSAALLPRNGFLRLFVRDLENNPRSQYKVHRIGVWYWVINFPLVTVLFFLAPTVWLKWGLYITLIYSVYANFSTDYAGMSAAMAAYEDRFLPAIPLAPFTGGHGGTGGRGGQGGAGRNGEPGKPGEPGEAGEKGEGT